VGGVLSVTDHKSRQGDLEISVADPDPLLFYPWVRDRKKSKAKIRGPSSGMNIPDLFFEKLVISFLG
jgi:hypothetical protein